MVVPTARRARNLAHWTVSVSRPLFTHLSHPSHQITVIHMSLPLTITIQTATLKRPQITRTTDALRPDRNDSLFARGDIPWRLSPHTPHNPQTRPTRRDIRRHQKSANDAPNNAPHQFGPNQSQLSAQQNRSTIKILQMRVHTSTVQPKTPSSSSASQLCSVDVHVCLWVCLLRGRLFSLCGGNRAARRWPLLGSVGPMCVSALHPMRRARQTRMVIGPRDDDAKPPNQPPANQPAACAPPSHTSTNTIRLFYQPSTTNNNPLLLLLLLPTPPRLPTNQPPHQKKTPSTNHRTAPAASFLVVCLLFDFLMICIVTLSHTHTHN